MELISREEVLALYKREQPHLATNVLEFEDMLKEIPVVEERITCNECDWCLKKKDSLQGRCYLGNGYPTGGWYCGNAKAKETEDDTQD